MNVEQLICSICLAAQENPLQLEHCVHSFCSGCISQWLDIKNNCPLCLNLIGNTQYNKLLVKPPEEVEFDSAALIFQHQIKTIDQTMKNLEKRINTKQQQSKNLKSHFPKSSLNYVSDQILVARNYYSLLQQAILINDNSNVSVYMQLITEVLLDIENVLEGGQVGKMHDDYDNDQSDSDSESDVDEDFEDYEYCQKVKNEVARQKKSSSNNVLSSKSSKVIKM